MAFGVSLRPLKDAVIIRRVDMNVIETTLNVFGSYDLVQWLDCRKENIWRKLNGVC